MAPPNSQEIAIVAIIQPAEGKLERLRELLAETIHWIEANEPDTLEFSLYEESPSENGGSVKLFMFERYASQAAQAAHESSEHYTAFFRTVAEEKLLAGAPVVVKGGFSQAFRR